MSTAHLCISITAKIQSRLTKIEAISGRRRHDGGSGAQCVSVCRPYVALYIVLVGFPGDLVAIIQIALVHSLTDLFACHFMFPSHLWCSVLD